MRASWMVAGSAVVGAVGWAAAEETRTVVVEVGPTGAACVKSVAAVGLPSYDGMRPMWVAKEAATAQLIPTDIRAKTELIPTDVAVKVVQCGSGAGGVGR